MERCETRRMLNWEQACRILGCKKSHFYNLVNSGRLPATRNGAVKGVRVLEEDCRAYLQQQSEAMLWGDK